MNYCVVFSSKSDSLDLYKRHALEISSIPSTPIPNPTSLARKVQSVLCSIS